MKLVNIEDYNMHYHNMILIENVVDLIEYYEKAGKKRISNALEFIRNNNQCDFNVLVDLSHSINGIYDLSDKINRTKYIIELSNNVYKNQLRRVLNDQKIAINIEGGYMPLSKDAKINYVQIQNNHKIFKSKFIK